MKHITRDQIEWMSKLGIPYNSSMSVKRASYLISAELQRRRKIEPFKDEMEENWEEY